jgi:hypothetical protein
MLESGFDQCARSSRINGPSQVAMFTRPKSWPNKLSARALSCSLTVIYAVAAISVRVIGLAQMKLQIIPKSQRFIHVW